MRTLALLLAAVLCMVANAEDKPKGKTVSTTMTVSATIVYNCQAIDERNAKFCKNVEIRKDGGYMYIRY